jgi:ankyrin repeat protein
MPPPGAQASRSALTMAAQNGRMEMVNFLISRGANVNARDWVRCLYTVSSAAGHDQV